MRYVRIYADDLGETHFEDVELHGTTRQSPVSTGISEYADAIPVEAAVFRRVVAAHPAEPHVAPCRQFAVHLEGRTEVEVSDGEVRLFGPGDVVLLEDTVGKGHVTREVGGGPRTSLFIELRA